MLSKRLFLICSIPAVITGCAEFDTQLPAPVYGNNTPLYGNKPLPQEQPKPPIEQPKPVAPETVQTAPLKVTPQELKPEPLPAGESILTPEQEKELSALEKQSVIPELNAEVEASAGADLKPKPKTKPEPKVEPVAEPEVIETPPTPTVFQPLENFTNLSPAVGSLVLAANKDSQKGNVEAATTTLERASRIEPRNAALYYKLALLKLKSKPSQAEDLAKKSAQLAANDPALKKHSWLLVAKAREMQKNFKGAQEARDRASKF